MGTLHVELGRDFGKYQQKTDRLGQTSNGPIAEIKLRSRPFYYLRHAVVTPRGLRAAPKRCFPRVQAGLYPTSNDWVQGVTSRSTIR